MFVYFMETDKHLKIGITNNIESRTKQVQTGCPVMIYLVTYIEVDNRENALQIEKHLHKQLKHLNTYGEWFYLFKQKVDKIILSELKKFNVSKDDIKIHLDYQDKKQNEISKDIVESIDKLRDKDLPYSKKIEVINKYYNRITNDNKDLYIIHSKSYLLYYCDREIKRYINLIKKAETQIESEAFKQIKLVLSDTNTAEEKIAIERKNKLIFDIMNKKEIKKVKSSNKEIQNKEQKMEKVLKKYPFLFNVGNK